MDDCPPVDFYETMDMYMVRGTQFQRRHTRTGNLFGSTHVYVLSKQPLIE